MSHAVLPPSSASMWVKCTGWATMGAAFPDDTESEESRLGTAVHELGALLIQGGDASQASAFLGLPLSNGVVVDEEMYESAELYASDVLAVLEAHPNAILQVEQTVSCKIIHELCWGTPDAVIFDPEKKVLFIWDYKHGRDLVEVYSNMQLITYAVGLMEHFGFNDFDVTLVMRIVQPRGFHKDGAIREWTTLGSDLRADLNRLINAATANLNGKGQCQSGEHCKYCDARTGCPTAIQAGISLFEVAGQPIPINMSPEAMALQYEILKRAEGAIKAMLAGFETKLIGQIINGAVIPGWGMTTTLGNRSWTCDDSEVAQLGDALNIDLRTHKVVTPAQAEKLGFDKATVAALTHRPKSGAALTKVDPQRAMRIFGA